MLNIKIIANLPTVLQQAEAIKLRLIFLPATTFFSPPSSPLSSAELLPSAAGK